MKTKLKLWLSINMNPFLVEETEHIQEDNQKLMTTTVVNLISNCGPSLTSLHLDLPIKVDIDEIF